MSKEFRLSPAITLLILCIPTVFSITLPQNLEYIGNGAFMGCTGLTLKDNTFPASLKEIAGNAFRRCDSFTEITVPGTVQKVGYCAFALCKNLKKAGFEYGIEELGLSMLYQCRGLEERVVPYRV